MLKANIVDDYRIRESGRIVNLAKTVYDVEKESPHYKNQADFINPKELVKLTKGPSIAGRVEHQRAGGKNRYFKTLNPWYKPYSYSTTAAQHAAKMNPASPAPTKTTDEDDVIIFESRFESGNLKKVIQVDRNEYELILKPDYGTKNYTQWFYFKMSNTRRYREYTFHLINFVKPDSQFNDGMMPLFYSTKEAASNNVGWYRAGYDIAYY